MGLPKKEFTDIIHLVAFELGMWSGIEVVITGLTRNQFDGNVTWVRIPPTPPENDRFLLESVVFN